MDSKASAVKSTLMIEKDDNVYALCTLSAGTVEQWHLDIDFDAGEEICFFLEGPPCENIFHITGALLLDDEEEGEDFDNFYGSDDCSEEEDGSDCCSDSDDNSADNDEDLNSSDEQSESDSFNEVEEIEEAATVAPKKRPVEAKVQEQAKKSKQEAMSVASSKDLVKKEQPKKEAVPAKMNSAVVEAAKKEVMPPKKDAAAKKEPTKKDSVIAEEVLTDKKLPSGLQIKDTLAGAGKRAKNGMKASVCYVGKLAATGKVFDSCTNPKKPFKFVIGKGSVIKGWDLGLPGMLVGGKRTLTIPASLAYGNKGAGKDIPPNAELRFEISLVDCE